MLDAVETMSYKISPSLARRSDTYLLAVVSHNKLGPVEPLYLFGRNRCECRFLLSVHRSLWEYRGWSGCGCGGLHYARHLLLQ